VAEHACWHRSAWARARDRRSAWRELRGLQESVAQGVPERGAKMNRTVPFTSLPA